ncbi:MAG: DEAD/DEAH box helicase, partial [Candidatus Omnitrophica bacterium]|nr:DEAD/DEAH box helicase [Candidatus Omnitrophota bacterium]
MFNNIVKMIRQIFGTQNEREIKRIEPFIKEINGLEKELEKLSDDEIKKKAREIRDCLHGEWEKLRPEVKAIKELISGASSDPERSKHKKTLIETKNRLLDKKLVEVFALCREASKRTIGLRHFDVQLTGGIVLHQGKIAEMVTGEGKTLVATLPVVLNAFAGEKVHVITVNDYLAKRDSEWMGPIYKFLGFTVGVIQNEMGPEDRKKVYSCDIVYGTNNEFGFDYLRDNMVVDREDIVQGDLGFAIVDEVDSILIDEARTPLIISGPVDETNESYKEMRPVVQEVARAQQRLTRENLTKCKEALNAGKLEEAGKFLYLVHKADPKNREFL